MLLAEHVLCEISSFACQKYVTIQGEPNAFGVFTETVQHLCVFIMANMSSMILFCYRFYQEISMGLGVATCQ